MNELMTNTVEAILHELLNGATKEAQEQALVNLTDLLDEEKRSASLYLLERLDKDLDGSRRGWCISALAMLEAPETVEVAVHHLDPGDEKQEWARYWSALALAKMQPPELGTHLDKAKNDDSELVRAIALRLLLENGIDAEENFNELLSMARDPKELRDRWAAFKVLRRRSGYQPLPEWVENRFALLLEERLTDNTEVQEVQRQAALALGDMHHKWREAVKILQRALETNRSDWVRRACVDALAAINKPEIKEAAVVALRDRDAEVRVRAAQALKQVLDVPGAVRFIVAEFVLRQERQSIEYLDALRQIDRVLTVDVLASYLQHSDPKIVARATQALAFLCNGEAVRALHTQRTKALEAYTKLLTDTDLQLTTQLGKLVGHARVASAVYIFLHGILALVGLIVLCAGLYVALLNPNAPQDMRQLGAGVAAGSAAALLILFYRSPLNSVRRTLVNLVQVNVVFLGYLRQISQIDALFKQQLIAFPEVDSARARETLEDIQESIEQTLESVRAHIEETD